MDTRQKIVPADTISRANRPVRLILGYFDPLHAAEVRRIFELCSCDKVNVVALHEGTEPLMPIRARAELAASLACVDYVVEGIDTLDGAEVFDERAAQVERRSALIDQVVRKHRAE